MQAIIGARLQLRRRTHDSWDLWVVMESRAHELIDGEEEGSTVLNRLLVMAAPVAVQPGVQQAVPSPGAQYARSHFSTAAEVLGVTHGRIAMRPGPPPPRASMKAGKAAKSDRASSRPATMPRRAVASSAADGVGSSKRDALK
jgi:hypothetical protein